MLALTLAGGSATRAETPLGEVVVEAPRESAPQAPPEDATAMGTSIDVRDAPTKVESLTEALAESVGVQVRRYGGLGDFATVSIRGFSPGQVRVYLDGVPLGRADDEAVNLGDLALDAVDRIDVYRGTTPLAFSESGPAGVVNVVTRRPGPTPLAAASLSYGSFQTRKADAAAGLSVGDADALIFASYLGSQGDFTYRDDYGTPDNPADDVTRTRINNAFNQGNLLARGGWRPAGGPLALGLLSNTFVKEQGMPGRGSVQSPDAHRSVVRQLAALNGTLLPMGTVPLTLETRSWLLFQDQNFFAPVGDPAFQPTDTTDRSLAAGAQVVARAALGTHHLPAALLAVDDDTIRTTNTLGAQQGTSPTRSRFHLALGGEDEVVLWDERVSLLPGIRWELFHDDFPVDRRAPPPLRTGGTSTRDFVSPRGGARVRPRPWLVLQGNVGRYTREPNLLELFGNSGTVQGNPSLLPETSVNGDAGFMVTGTPWPGWIDDASFGAAWFGASISDVIVLLPSSVSVFRPANVSDARILGAEVQGALRVARNVGAVLNYTYQDAQQVGGLYDGNQLPGRPADEVYARLELDWAPARPLPGLARAWPGRLWYEMDFIADNYLDKANVQRVGSRALQTVGVELLLVPLARARATFEVQNLADDQTQDVLGFPLPGRALFVTLSWGFDAPSS